MIRNKRAGYAKEEGQASEERAARFNNVPEANRYQELKAIRPSLRAEYIAKGLIQDPNKPIRLDQAINFVGTCQDMCPEFEREEREYQKNLEKFEVIPGTNRIDHARAVKAYHRPAAGNEQPLPSDVRPPPVLTRTLDYLIDEIVGNDPGLEDSHGFIRDRTRSIRQDFTLQNCRSLEAVLAHERIARYHILCLHQLCDNPNFSEQQETEQLRKVLRSLQEFYDDLREEGIPCPNEAEFRAYNIITHLRDIDIARQAQLYPKEIFCSSIVQQALKFHSLCQCNNIYFKRNMSPNCEAAQNFFSKFFKLVKNSRTTYLMACLLEWHFVEVRRNALKAMNKTYLYQLQGFPISDLVDLLRFDDANQAIQACQDYGLEVVEDPVLVVKFGKKDAKSKRLIFYESDQTFKQIKSMTLVEKKRDGLSNRDIINGCTSNNGTDLNPFAMTFDLTLPEAKYTVTDSKSQKRFNGISSESVLTRSIPSPSRSTLFTQNPPVSTSLAPGSRPNFSFSMNALEKIPMTSSALPVSTTNKSSLMPPKIPAFSSQQMMAQPGLSTFKTTALPSEATPSVFGVPEQGKSVVTSGSEYILDTQPTPVPSTELVKQRLAALEKAKEDKEKKQRLIDLVSGQLLESIVLETTENHVSTFVRTSIAQYIEHERKRNALLESIAEEAFQFLFFNIVQESIASTVATSISNFKSLKNQFTLWKDIYIEIKTQREIERQLALKSSLNFRSLGVCNPQTSLDEQVRLLVGVSKNGLTQGRGLTITEDSNGQNIATALEEVDHSKSLWDPIPVSTLLKQSLSSEAWNVPWSLGICYDSMNELTAKWLRIKLGPSLVWPKTANGIYAFDSHEDSHQYSISLIPNDSLEHVQPKSMKFSATIFQVSFFPDDHVNKEKIAKYWFEQREKLRKFLYLSSDLHLPLLIVFWPSSDESIVRFKQSAESGLGLRSFSGHKLISAFHILIMTTEMMDYGLRDNLKWLASRTIQKRTQQTDKLNVLLNGFQELYDWVLYKIREKIKSSCRGISTIQNISIANLIATTFNAIIFELVRTISSENSNPNATSLRVLEMCVIPTIVTPTHETHLDTINLLTHAYDEFIHSVSSMAQNEKDLLYGRVCQMITRKPLEQFSYNEIFNRIGQSILEKLKEYSLDAPLPKDTEGLLKRCRTSVHSQIFQWETEYENQENPGPNKRKAELASIVNIHSPKKTKAYSQESPKTNGLSKLISDVKEWLSSL